MAPPAINFNAFLEKEKLKNTGSNFTDWFRNLRIILNAGQKTYVLDAPLGDPPAADAPEEDKNVYLSRKEHQVLMVNKTTSFKKQGKPKKGGNKAAAPPKKPKAGPKPDTECFYCKGDSPWKRNCPKYLADLKNGNIKKKGIFDIHVIDVYLTSTRSSAWVFDTGSVANICNLKQELRNKRRLARDEVTMRFGNGFKVD